MENESRYFLPSANPPNVPDCTVTFADPQAYVGILASDIFGKKLLCHKWVTNREIAFWSDRSARVQSRRRRKKIATAATKTSTGDQVGAASGCIEPYLQPRGARAIQRAQHKILDAVVVDINIEGKACVRHLIRFRIDNFRLRRPGQRQHTHSRCGCHLRVRIESPVKGIGNFECLAGLGSAGYKFFRQRHPIIRPPISTVNAQLLKSDVSPIVRTLMG